MSHHASVVEGRGPSNALAGRWQTVRLGDVGEIVSGITLGRRLMGQPTRPVPYLRVANVKDGRLDLSEVYQIEVTEGEIAKLRLRWGDLLLTEGGDPDKLGRGTYWNDELPECIHQNHVFRVRFNTDQFDPAFVAAYIGSPSGKAYFLTHAKQTTGIATINQKVLGNFPLIAPSLPEQRRIAAQVAEQMAAVERARAAAAAQVAGARELAPAYIRTAFRSVQGEDMPRVPLDDLCSIVAPQVDPRLPEYGSLPHVNGENIESGTRRLLTVRSASEDGMKSGKYLFKRGDVLYSKLRPYLRKVVVADFDGLCSADMYPIEVASDRLDPNYLAWLLLSDEFTVYAEEESRRARMPKLNREQLFAWQAPVPSLETQRQIASSIERSIEQAHQVRRLLDQAAHSIDALPAAILKRAFAGGAGAGGEAGE
ncbi:MAG: restriction endonuclease subunit S [Chloroflexi bacterium]|nr:restriction endonuclease subunit S [Chloroflexota bacterium]